MLFIRQNQTNLNKNIIHLQVGEYSSKDFSLCYAVLLEIIQYLTLQANWLPFFLDVNVKKKKKKVLELLNYCKERLFLYTCVLCFEL